MGWMGYWWVGQRVMILIMKTNNRVHRTGTILAIRDTVNEIKVKVDKKSGFLWFTPEELFPLQIQPGHLEP